MSLNVYLTVEEPVDVNTEPAIYIRAGGRNVRVTRAVWDALRPGREPVVAIHERGSLQCVYSGNITHNLSRMAREAGIYNALWRPEEIGIATANQLIDPLVNGLNRLRNAPSRFQQFNPISGWGSYDVLVGFAAEYLEACVSYPDAAIRTSR